MSKTGEQSYNLEERTAKLVYFKQQEIEIKTIEIQ